MIFKTFFSKFQLNMYQPAGPTFYLWRNLSPATTYAFTVSACNGFTNECGPPSNIVTGETRKLEGTIIKKKTKGPC
jgi:hypothetical protein